MELLVILIYALIMGFAGYKFALMMNNYSQAKLNPKLSACIGFLLGIKGIALLLCYYIVSGVIINFKNKK